MTETKPKRRWFSFSIRDLLWLMAVVAMGVGWWIDTPITALGEKHFRCLALGRYGTLELFAVGKLA